MIKFLAGAFLLLFSFTAAAQTPEDSVAFAGARWQITPLAAGAEYVCWDHRPYQGREYV